MTKSGIEDVRARFDRVAAEWDSNPARGALARAVTDAILKTVPLRPDMNAMDFGAGTGLLTLGLLPHVGSIAAMDASGEMLRSLNEKLRALGIDKVHTMLCDISTTPLPVAGFDLIASSMVLHHIPDVPLTLQRLRPCLRPGGWIAMADLDSEDGTFHTDSTGVYHHGFDRGEVCRWLEQAGFNDATARGAYLIVRRAPDGEAREYPVFLVTGRAG